MPSKVRWPSRLGPMWQFDVTVGVFPINSESTRLAMRQKKFLMLNALATAVSVTGGAHAADQPYQGKVGKTLADSKEWWPDPVKAPAGSPNVIWILLDDVGFGAASAFGGVIDTPTFDQLA